MQPRVQQPRPLIPLLHALLHARLHHVAVVVHVSVIIMFAPGDFLDGQYTIVGKVTSGLEVLDAIKRGNSRSGSITGAPDFMKSVTVTE